MLGYLFCLEISASRIQLNYIAKTIFSLYEASTNKDEYFDILTKLSDRSHKTYIHCDFSFQYIDFGDIHINGRQELIQIYKNDNKAYYTASNPIIINSYETFDKYLPKKYYDGRYLNASNLVFFYDNYYKNLTALISCFVDTPSTSKVWLIGSYTAYRFDFKQSFDSLTDYTKYILENYPQ
jgi:hypothetical protein